MKKFSEKTRKLLRAIYMGLGASAVALMFQACYGMPLPEGLHLRGQVLSEGEEEAINGIHISWKDNETFFTTSSSDGCFSLYISEEEFYSSPTKTVVFKDLDGNDNGGNFQTLERKVSYDDNYSPITVSLSLKTE